MIYKVTNMINGKIYIGQTRGSLHNRILRHKNDSKHNRYKSHFLTAIRKYGIENFKWEILELCNDEELDGKEIYWILEYRKNGLCYNIQNGGQGKFNPTNIPVSAYTEDGNLYGKYSSIKEASKETGISNCAISMCISGKRKSAGTINGARLVWTSNETIPNIPKRWRRGVRVEALTEDGVSIGKFDCAIDGAIFVGLKSQATIMKCLSGKSNYSGFYLGKKVTWKRG